MKKLDGFDLYILIVVCIFGLMGMCFIGSEMVKEVATIMAGCG